MIKRISAFKKIFNLLLTVVELLIGLGFLVNMFGSSESVGNLIAVVSSLLQQINYGASGIFGNLDLAGPASFLIFVLGFMFFSFILITMVPNAARRLEIEMEDEFE
jgi:hypothetical protein